ncbi:trypsin-like peptidase domain-containing protein [Acinetobacter baumannii]|nr:trypsin-like peptidase domain-containing protein [Acinetobacter baumannii]EMB9898108.1 trypsin-like peptidase domain-containing protein [Acinetobacter baumannii]
MFASITIAESMLYSTVKITAISQGSAIGTGTGFFSTFCKTHDSFLPVIITNKHVIEGADRIFINCHIEDNNTYKASGKFLDVFIDLQETLIMHPDPNIDLCAINFSSCIEQATEQGISIFYTPVGFELIPDESEWEFFDAIEEVTMIGCPNGLSDSVNNLPIIRQGVTATSPSFPYNGKQEFMVDMACFPGSSGSPIFLYNKNGYFDGKSKSYIMGAARLRLLGILYSGPLISNTGQITLNTSFKFDVASMILGNAIRSSELKKLELYASTYLNI